MIKFKLIHSSLLKVNNSIQGETIETKIERIVGNKEPIKDGAPIIYTDRKEGVMPDYDIRTDRFEYAIEAMTKVAKGKRAQRENFYKEKAAKAAGATTEGAGKNGKEPSAGSAE